MAKKRAVGEGTIYARKDGRWEYALTALTTDGTRKRIRRYAPTRAEADKRLTELKQQVQHGTPVPSAVWKLGDYLDYWLENAVRVKRRALTYRRSEAIVRLHLKPNLGSYRLDALSVRVVQDFIDRYFASGQSAATVYQIRKVLSAALTYALRTELLVRNVARLVELPTYRPTEAEHWTLDELRRFLRAAQSDPLYPAFLLLALYGFRRGEVLGFRWCDVDFARYELRVRQQVQRIGGELREVALKTYASKRDEPLLPAAEDALRKQHAQQEAARAASGAAWQGARTGHELVFTTRSGRPIESRNLYRSFLRICEAHGLRRITIHGIRHTNATAQKELNVQPRDVQAILGHSDLRTTGIYEHVGMDDKRAALQLVEAQLLSDSASTVPGRHELPSAAQSVAENTMNNFGGSSQTRTGDTRLFRAAQQGAQERVAEVKRIVRDRQRQWLCGVVAVNFSRQDSQVGLRPKALQARPAAASRLHVARCAPSTCIRRERPGMA